MSERAAYSRVYWSVIDDPKFETIYDDDHHLATWLRLLLAADQSWPASANLPASVRKASVAALCAVGLVDVTGYRFRIRGLDAERERRAEAGRIGGKASGVARTTVERSLERSLNGRSQTVPMSRQPRRDETRQDKTSISARDGLPHITPDAQRLLETLTGQSIRTAGDRQLTEYDRQLETHGLPAVTAAYRRVAETIKNPTARQVIWSALRVLEPFTTPQDIAKAESSTSSKAELERTRRYIDSQRETA